MMRWAAIVFLLLIILACGRAGLTPDEQDQLEEKYDYCESERDCFCFD